MSEGSKDAGEGLVRPALSLSHKQVGMVRVHLSHFSEKPRKPTLEALGVWPHWDTIVAELEEKMVRETILGLDKTFEDATAGHAAADSELDDEQLEQLVPIVDPLPGDTRSPRLSLFAMASLFATLLVEPEEFEAECRKRNTTQNELTEDAVLWGIVFDGDGSIAQQWEEELAFALQYLTREVRLEDLPTKETAPTLETPQPIEAGSSIASEPAPAAPTQQPFGSFQVPAVVAPQQVPPSSAEPQANTDMSGIDSTAVGVRIDFGDEPLPFEAGDFVPEPITAASSQAKGSTGFFQAGDLLQPEATPFEEVAPAPSQSASEVSMRMYAGLCVDRQLWPDQEAQIYARYQIDAQRAKALDAEFRIRLQDPNELKDYYEQVAAHQKWLKEQR